MKQKNVPSNRCQTSQHNRPDTRVSKASACRRSTSKAYIRESRFASQETTRQKGRRQGSPRSRIVNCCFFFFCASVKFSQSAQESTYFSRFSSLSTRQNSFCESIVGRGLDMWLACASLTWVGTSCTQHMDAAQSFCCVLTSIASRIFNNSEEHRQQYLLT